MSVSIYILKLENNKYYVGRSNNAELRIKKHFSGNGSAWTNKYKPIKPIKIINDCDNYDEDKITKQYMSKYGIDNVRGGSYCQIVLSDDVKQFITNEINNVKNVCFKCGQAGHFINYCPNKNTSSDISEKSYNIVEPTQYENDFIRPDNYYIDTTDSSDSEYVPSDMEYSDDEYLSDKEYDSEYNSELYNKYIDNVNDNKSVIGLFNKSPIVTYFKQINMSKVVEFNIMLFTCVSLYYCYTNRNNIYENNEI